MVVFLLVMHLDGGWRRLNGFDAGGAAEVGLDVDVWLLRFIFGCVCLKQDLGHVVIEHCY